MSEPKRVVVRVAPNGHGTVEIDGKPVSNCSAVKVQAAVNKPTTVTLQLVACDVDFESENVDEVIVETTNMSSVNREYVAK